LRVGAIVSPREATPSTLDGPNLSQLAPHCANLMAKGGLVDSVPYPMPSIGMIVGPRATPSSASDDPDRTNNRLAQNPLASSRNNGIVITVPLREKRSGAGRRLAQNRLAKSMNASAPKSAGTALENNVRNQKSDFAAVSSPGTYGVAAAGLIPGDTIEEGKELPPREFSPVCRQKAKQPLTQIHEDEMAIVRGEMDQVGLNALEMPPTEPERRKK